MPIDFSISSPDVVTNGGGAAQVTVDTINAVWRNAHQMANGSAQLTNQALVFSSTPPQMAITALDTSYVGPVVPTLPDQNAFDGEAMFNTQRDNMLAIVTNNTAVFMQTYFPDRAFYTNALNWINRAMTTGGSGINVDIENALIERARARVLTDSMRDEDEAFSTYADKRMPLPAGPLAFAVQRIRTDAGRKIAEISRDIAIKSFDAELENAKFAVGQALDLYLKAFNAVGDYVKTLMRAPEIAMQLTTGLANIRTEAARALVQLYSAETSALQPRVQLAIADAQLRQQAGEANLRAKSQGEAERVNAVLSAANVLGTAAAAGINAIGGRASISGQDSSSV